MPPASHPPMQQATMFMPHQAQPAPQVPEVLALLHFLFTHSSLQHHMHKWSSLSGSFQMSRSGDFPFIL